MKRLIICSLTTALAVFGIAVCCLAFRDCFILHKPDNGIVGALFSILVMATVAWIGVWMTINILSAGSPIHSAILLSRGQVIRLIAVSVPIEGDRPGKIGILAELKKGVIRYIYIEYKGVLQDLTPGCYYRYVKFGRIEVSPVGKL
jgi:hypothetical protein